MEISFNKNLISLKDFFKNNIQLIKADFKNFIMEDVKSMENTFSGCLNLNEIDLEGVNSYNLINMDKTLEKCTNLKSKN